MSVKYLQPKFEEEKAEVARGKLVMNWTNPNKKFLQSTHHNKSFSQLHTYLYNNKGVYPTMALPFIYIKKYFFQAKEELWKLKLFTTQKYNLQKQSSKINKPKSFKIS